MAVKDSYSEWLGLATPQRPPNHYQLLGLEEFEPDRRRIEEAARRQTEKLRPHQQGSATERESADRLLLAVQRAEYVLADPKRRAEYDRSLKEIREKGAPKGVHLSVVAAQQELVAQRDRAATNQQWQEAEELADRLVAADPEDPAHKEALERIRTRAARARQMRLVMKVAKGVVVIVVLVSVGILAVKLVQQQAAKEDPVSRGEAHEANGEWSSAADAYREAAEGGNERARPRMEAAEAAARAEKLVDEKRYAEALAELKKARRGAGRQAAVQERIQSLQRKLEHAKEQAQDRAEAAEARADLQTALHSYQELIDLGGDKEIKVRREAIQAILKAEQLEKAGKFEEALAAYKEIVETVSCRSEIESRISKLEERIAATRPQLRY